MEDDYEMQTVVVETLEDEGYLVHGASSVAEALQKAQTVTFDILVTDVRMAETDGVTGFKLLKEQLPELRCIVITGYSDNEVTERAIELQVDDYIVKPFTIKVLCKAVKRVVERHELSNHYLDVLKRLPKGLFSTAMRFFKTEDKVKLDEVRGQLFQALHVGIRSTHLNKFSANRLFYDLVAYDERHKAYLLKQDADVAEELLRDYKTLLEVLKGLLRQGGVSQYTGQGSFPSAVFDRIYQGIQSGDITLEALQLAPGLKNIDSGELLTSPEAKRIREMLWGEKLAG